MTKERKKISKKGLIIIISILIILILSLIFFFKNNNFFTSHTMTDGELFKEEYEKLNSKLTSKNKKYPKVNINKDNIIKYSTIEGIVDIFKNKGDAVVYFGYSTCLYCRTAVQILLDTAKKTEIDTIYYLDVEKQSAIYNELYQELDEELVEKNLIEAPLVIFIVNGNVVSYNKGTISSQRTPYKLLDTSQKIALEEIYRYGIEDVLFSINLKKEVTTE